EREELIRVLNDAPSSDTNTSRDLVTRIRSRTFQKLGLPYHGDSTDGRPASPTTVPVQAHGMISTRAGRMRGLAAAAVAVVLVGGIVFHKPAMAALQNVLQFVPGFGYVMENPTPETALVAPAPIEFDVGNQSVEIGAVLWDAKETLLRVSGPAFLQWPEHITIIASDGKSYRLGYGSVGLSPDEWVGVYWYQGLIPVDGSNNPSSNTPANVHVTTWTLRWPGVSHTVSLHLVKPTSVTAYHQLGPTDTAHHVTMTAVPVRFGNKVRVTLVSPPSRQYHIDDYGIMGITTGTPEVQVRDTAGKVVPASIVPGFDPQNQFDIYPAAHDGSTFLVTIPYISTTYNASADMNIPVPAPGHSLMWNHDLSMAGFDLTFTKVSRTANHLRIAVQVRNRSSDPRSLSMFGQLWQRQLFSSHPLSWSSHMDAKTLNVRWFGFDVTNNARNVHLVIEQPKVILYGPWHFTLHVPSK
ncbi:MAG: hypothetical protein K6T83_24170, partial [Alicyclobacillus sp.]|nr:hypothetical protein [Alicyclobacillus sp.]